MSNYKITTVITWGQTYHELANEFKLWGIRDWEVSKPRGATFTGWNQTPEDRTVHLRYKKDNKEIVLEMGKQARAVDNIRVLFLAIQSMRLNEKRGIGELLQTAYKQLAGPPGMEPTIDPYQVLGVTRGLDLEVYEAVYRTMAKKYHPDSGVSANEEMMDKLNKAIGMIREST